MKHLSMLFTMIFLMTSEGILFDFSKEADISKWRVINDGVMGGLSKGNFILNDQGHGVFAGKVSLENNGGFSMVSYVFPKYSVKDAAYIVLKVKGDGKRYQFRLKSDRYQRYSFIQYFETNGDWQTIKLKLNDFYAYFRGYRLDIPNFSGEQLEEIAFLIGNKKAESFELMVDTIYLE